MPSIGAPELMVVLLVLVPLVVSIFTIVDVARRSEAAFSAAGQNRTVWLLVAIFGLVIPCVWLGSVYYLAAVRPKLTRTGYA